MLARSLARVVSRGRPQDGMIVSGRAVPTMRNCSVSGRRNALTLLDSARGEWIDCRFAHAKLAGLKVMGRARPTLRRCHLSASREEGVCVQAEGSAELLECHLRDNGGPGVDVSGRGTVRMAGCWVEGNGGGGAMVWDGGKLEMDSCHLGAGGALALLADGPLASAALRDCVVSGAVHAGEAVWAGLRAGGNRMDAEGGDRARGMKPLPGSAEAEGIGGGQGMLPAEAGAFKWEADKYTRKQ